jgi:hypothetical protein
VKELRSFTPKGAEFFNSWLLHGDSDKFPTEILFSEDYTTPSLALLVDETMVFATRYEFGIYLNELFSGHALQALMEAELDNTWSWLAALYFDQLKKYRPGRRFQSNEHFIVMRKGLKGSLAYRQAPRICFELVRVHGAAAKVCLTQPMNTFGDMAEQLASRSYLARNVGFFQAAAKLYLRGDKVAPGATSYPTPPTRRKVGDKKGYGGMRRFETRLKRLQLVYDTDDMASSDLLALLPKEFAKYRVDQAT